MEQTISTWQLHMHCNWCIDKVIASGLGCNSQIGPTTRFHVIRDDNGSLRLVQNSTLDITRDPGGGALPTMTYTKRLRPKRVPFSRFRYMKG